VLLHATVTLLNSSVKIDLLLHTDSGVDKMPSGQLIADMETAKDSLWKKHGRTSLCFISRTFPL